MKESKILKITSYILLPIFILIIFLSCFLEVGKESMQNKQQFKEDEFFKTDDFLSAYMYMLSNQTKNLIYQNSRYSSIKDGDIRICYNVVDKPDCSLPYLYNVTVKNKYFLILYKNLALTNVELTESTNTIEEIKNFIQNNDKKVNIVNGIVESDNEIFSNKAIKYWELFNINYYSISEGQQQKEIIVTESPDNNYETEISEEPLAVAETPSTKEYFNTTINDFQIYSSYKEEIIYNSSEKLFEKFVEELGKYENTLYTLTPVSVIGGVLLLVYLIISIGHTKNKEEIDLNDIDKIPLEIVLLIGGIIYGIMIGIMFGVIPKLNISHYVFAVNLFFAIYFSSYIIGMVMAVTIIKRIKAKTFVKSSFILKICVKFINMIKKLFKKFIGMIKNLREVLPKTWKLILLIVGYTVISFILVLMFEEFGFFLGLVLGAYILYKILLEIRSYQKLEEHLKAMYEGDNLRKLDEKDFTKEFENVVKYVNDISKGFENAIQEGIKSERLKTELITNVSHDIKTPLTSIINYVDLIKKENIDNEKIKEYIDVLDNKSQRLKKLTEDLVEASKASSGNVKLNNEKINICELINQSVGEFEDKFKNKNLDLILNIPEEEIYINADNRYMYRIIENLFSNISKYALESSRVYVDITKTEEKTKIEIKNISKEKLNISADELMQRFVRGDKSRTTEGSGLGISISKSLTELQKGKFNLVVDGDLFKIELEFNIA